MNKLKTMYMGIELSNPIILGASNLVTDPDNLKKAEEMGAGAIVYKRAQYVDLLLNSEEIFEGT